MLHTKFGKGCCEEEDINTRRTKDVARGTTHDDGRQLIALGHLSDLSDLKIKKEVSFYGVRIGRALTVIEKFLAGKVSEHFKNI